jgi:hypothetical protein
MREMVTEHITADSVFWGNFIIGEKIFIGVSGHFMV